MEPIKIKYGADTKFHYSSAVEKMVLDEMKSLKFFTKEKSVNHEPPRNHFLYWENSIELMKSGDVYAIVIPLYINTQEGVSGDIIYLAEYDFDCHEFSTPFSVYSYDDIDEENDLAIADYHYGLRVMGGTILQQPWFINLFEDEIKIFKRDEALNTLGV
jgi:hypothetical protein